MNKNDRIGLKTVADVWDSLSPAALGELKALGISGPGFDRNVPAQGIDPVPGRDVVKRSAIHAPQIINEAHDYEKPSSFSRGVKLDVGNSSLIFLSGTASVNEQGKAAHIGDFRAQCLRTYRNLTELLVAEQASWHDVIRTTCYLRDIERDYEAFNEIRTLFFKELGLNPLPASTGIQARLCWPELLVEIELIAVVPKANCGCQGKHD